MPVSAEQVFLLIVILPGFLGYFAFSHLYCREIEDVIDKFCYIILFNLIPLLLLSWVEGKGAIPKIELSRIGTDQIVGYVSSVLLILCFVSLVFGAACAAIGNTGRVQKIFRTMGWTKKTSYSSVLADVICSHPDAFLKVRFKSGGYIIGHPRKYSMHGKEEVLFIADAARRPARRGSDVPQPLERSVDGPGILLLKFDDVSYVEVLNGGD